MLTEEQINTITTNDVKFKTSRSGGKGGQNVNKVETKVELIFDVEKSTALTEAQKTLILKKHSDLINDSVIQLFSENHRTQLANKQQAVKKLILLLNKQLKPTKKRVATKPSKSSVEKKVNNKKHLSKLKQLRKRII